MRQLLPLPRPAPIPSFHRWWLLINDLCCDSTPVTGEPNLCHREPQLGLGSYVESRFSAARVSRSGSGWWPHRKVTLLHRFCLLTALYLPSSSVWQKMEINIQKVLENNRFIECTFSYRYYTKCFTCMIRFNPSDNPTGEVILLYLLCKELCLLWPASARIGAGPWAMMYAYLRPLQDSDSNFYGTNPLTTACFSSLAGAYILLFLLPPSTFNSADLAAPARGPLTNQRLFQCSTPTLKNRKARRTQPTSCIWAKFPPVVQPRQAFMQHLSASHQLSNHQLGVSRVHLLIHLFNNDALLIMGLLWTAANWKNTDEWLIHLFSPLFI